MNSRNYWIKRELQAKKKAIADEKAYNRELDRIYKDLQNSIDKEINAFYGRYASKEGISIAEAKKRADRLDIESYEQKAKEFVANKDLSDYANEAMRLYNLTMKVNRLELLKSNLGLEMIKAFGDVDKLMGKALTERAKSVSERMAGILGESAELNERYIGTLVNASFKNATYSQRIWNYQDELKNRLGTLLSQGLIQGKGSIELARTLRKEFDVSRYESERLMRTELARVQIGAQKKSIQDSGYDEYEYLTLSSAEFTSYKVCPICAELDGKHFKVKDMQIGENAPPMHPFCRCSIAPYIDVDDYEKWLNRYSNIDEIEDSKEFRDTLLKASNSQSPIKRWRVDKSYSINDYNNISKFVSKGGSTLAITKDGDIISVCKNVKDSGLYGSDLLKYAVESGGKKLDAYGKELYDFYTRNGFEPTGWTSFNPEYAPPDWKPEFTKKTINGNNDSNVIAYKYTGKKFNKTYDEFIEETKEVLDYLKLIEERDKLL